MRVRFLSRTKLEARGSLSGFSSRATASRWRSARTATSVRLNPSALRFRFRSGSDLRPQHTGPPFTRSDESCGRGTKAGI